MSNQQETVDKKDEKTTKEVKPETQPVIEAIEEDDEFEEFEPCHWDDKNEDANDAQQWQVSFEYCYKGIVFLF